MDHAILEENKVRYLLHLIKFTKPDLYWDEFSPYRIWVGPKEDRMRVWEFRWEGLPKGIRAKLVKTSRGATIAFTEVRTDTVVRAHLLSDLLEIEYTRSEDGQGIIYHPRSPIENRSLKEEVGRLIDAPVSHTAQERIARHMQHTKRDKPPATIIIAEDKNGECHSVQLYLSSSDIYSARKCGLEDGILVTAPSYQQEDGRYQVHAVCGSDLRTAGLFMPVYEAEEA